MEFETEEQLVNLLEKVYSSPRSRWVWIREFNMPNGIADLVGIGLATHAANRSTLGHIPPQWAYTLHCLPHEEPFSLGNVATLANVTMGSARLMLRNFGDSGFCAQIPDSKQWIKTRQPEPVAKKIVAIEAKLRDWRRALYQAAQHVAYASQAWVVLDRSALPSSRRHAQEFADRGIGLAGLSAEGELDIVMHPRDNLPRRQNRYWQANAEIARARRLM